MNRMAKFLIILGGMAAIAAVLVACSNATTETPTACPTCAAVTTTPCPETACPTPQPTAETVQVPNLSLWESSGHADKTAVPFTHWDSEGEIPVTCAKCHSSPGFLDYIGADGTEAGTVNNPAPIGTFITCVTCHNPTAEAIDTVSFPSGAQISGVGNQAVCLICHQGVESGNSVTEAISALGSSVDQDTVYSDLSFINVHYFAAAIARYGTLVQGGYQYPGMSYDASFDHVFGYQSCNTCHNPHSLSVNLEDCATCHTFVTTAADLQDIRVQAAPVDYDGNGNTTEGMYYEVQGMQKLLFTAMQSYAKEVAGSPIVYDPDAYPYFFIDTNDNGEPDQDETTMSNQYASWTPRLLEAAYNYHASIKDPGVYAHGGNYFIELLYDGTESLNEKITNPVDLSNAHRVNNPHFDGAAQAFSHWNGDASIPGSCAKCHSATGLPEYLSQGVTSDQPVSNALMCSTCHDDLVKFTRRTDDSVTFPSGVSLSFADNKDANLCLNCHQGRTAGSTLTASITSAEDAANAAAQQAGNPTVTYSDDTSVPGLTFTDIHYFPAGVTLFGSESKGVYEYPGQTYASQFMHVTGYDTCIGCHDTHTSAVQVQACAGCHGVNNPDELKFGAGQGDTATSIATQFETMKTRLYDGIQTYAKQVLDKPIVFSAGTYPYFFNDTNGNGVADADETAFSNQYSSFSPRLDRAAYNFLYAVNDPGAYAHNGVFVLQVLYDTLDDLSQKVSVDMSGLVRPQ